MKKLILSAITAGLLLTSCGGGGNAEQATEAAKPKIGAAEDNSNKKDIPEMVEVTIEGNDQMKYDKSRIDVFAGQKVKLTLKHVGEMPKETMGHNWVLLKNGVDMAEFAAEASQAKDQDYLPSNLEDQVIVHTKTLGGGEQTTIEFEAPEKGTYTFICTFPGHYGMMNGKFAVN